MNIFSIYEIATGRLTGGRVSMTAPQLLLLDFAVPEGCGVVLGEWDYDAYLVDHETGDVRPVELPSGGQA